MNCCYINYSEKLNKRYIGICHYSLEKRIETHNEHQYGEQRFTAKANDWVLILKIDFESVSKARKIELQIKKMKSSIYIQNLTKYPEMVEKIKMKFNG